MAKHPAKAGRPQADDLTKQLLQNTLQILGTDGYEATTIAKIASQTKTSKQAIYRRWSGKEDLIAAALASAYGETHLPSPNRGSVAQDLFNALSALVTAMQDTDLGNALKALSSLRLQPPFRQILKDAEDAQRFAMRQILIATPFEQDMETRIDLLLGLVSSKLLLGGERLGDQEIDSAIQLVLGLTAPRAPALAPLPGL